MRKFFNLKSAFLLIAVAVVVSAVIFLFRGNGTYCSRSMNGIVLSSEVIDTVTGTGVELYLDYGKGDKIRVYTKHKFFSDYKPEECTAFLNKFYFDSKYLVYNEDNNRFNFLVGKRNGKEIEFIRGYMFFDKVLLKGYGIKDSELDEIRSLDEYLKEKIDGYVQIENFEFTRIGRNESNSLSITVSATASKSPSKDLEFFEIEVSFDENLKILKIEKFNLKK